MKVSMLLLFSAISVFGAKENCTEIKKEWTRLLEPYHTNCICATGVQQYLADDFLHNFTFSNNPCMKCYLSCLHKNLGLMRADNAIDAKGLSTVAAAVTYDIAKKCSDKVANITDPCIVSYELSLCVTDAVYKTC